MPGVSGFSSICLRSSMAAASTSPSLAVLVALNSDAGTRSALLDDTQHLPSSSIVDDVVAEAVAVASRMSKARTVGRNSRSCSIVTPPGRRIIGPRGWCRSSTVDSTPTSHEPPSTTQYTPSDTACRTPSSNLALLEVGVELAVSVDGAWRVSTIDSPSKSKMARYGRARSWIT